MLVNRGLRSRREMLNSGLHVPENWWSRERRRVSGWGRAAPTKGASLPPYQQLPQRFYLNVSTPTISCNESTATPHVIAHNQTGPMHVPHRMFSQTTQNHFYSDQPVISDNRLQQSRIYDDSIPTAEVTTCRYYCHTTNTLPRAVVSTRHRLASSQR